MRNCHGGNETEAGQRAGGGDGGTPDSGQIIAIGMRDFFDDSEHMQALELPRHGGRRDVQVGK